jgi:hypothetical protein
MPGAAVAVHPLRYWLAFGDECSWAGRAGVSRSGTDPVGQHADRSGSLMSGAGQHWS